MPLLAFLQSNPSEVEGMSLSQILSTCGNGRLTDGSDCSSEFRHYAGLVSSRRLTELVEACLQPGEKHGFALQDLVNEVGRRLDLQIEHGRYQGNRSEVGFDGLWRTSTDHAIVVEVKTTDAYRINLDTVATYRDRLIDQGHVTRRSSILIVVLREDTGDLEAQVRGSRHAWDIRIISVDALLKLLKVKEETEARTQRQIEELLVPFEYTKLDRIIEVAFTVISDIESLTPESEDLAASEARAVVMRYGSPQERTPTVVLNATRAKALDALGQKLGVRLEKKSQARYASAGDEKEVHVACSTSKIYEDGGLWYALHPAWCEFMEQGVQGLFVLTGVGLPGYFVIPSGWIIEKTPNLWKTERKGSMYWHIVCRPTSEGWVLMLRDPAKAVSLQAFYNPY